MKVTPQSGLDATDWRDAIWLRAGSYCVRVPSSYRVAKIGCSVKKEDRALAGEEEEMKL